MKKMGREFLRSRAFRVAVLGCLAVSLLCCTALAEEVSGGTSIDVNGITSAFTNGFNSMVTNSIAMVSAMVPIALTLAGVLFLVKKAMSWFKSMAK